MRVRIVIQPDNARWILGKFATRLQSELSGLGHKVEVDRTPSTEVDVNHWIHFIQYDRSFTRPVNTLMVTHLDRYDRFLHLRTSLAVADAGVCMSRETVEMLAKRGIDRRKLCAINPAHDQVLQPRRIVIGITSRLYADGRKCESKLIHLADHLRLDDFHFVIIGQGWEAMIARLEAAGATVDYRPGSDDFQEDYRANLELVPRLDYYLYTGEDEGSMGFIDALAAGVATIVTPQGFHLDAPGGITHPFWTGEDLVGVFRAIGDQRRRRVGSVRHMTWRSHAEAHATLWQGLLAGRAAGEFDFVPSWPDVPLPRKAAWRSEYDFWVKPLARKVIARARRLARVKG
jgi:hypothetical protein